METDEIKKELSRKLKRKENQIKSLSGWFIAFVAFSLIVFWVFQIPDSFLNWMKRIALFMGLFFLLFGIHHILERQKKEIQDDLDNLPS